MKYNAIMLIERVNALTRSWLTSELAAAGLSGMVPSHGDVLALLFAKGEATMHELAAFAHRTKPTTTVLVDKLEEMGLVLRKKSSDDARRVVVALTDEGESLRGTFESISRRLVRRVYAPLDREEGETFERLLTKVLVNLEAKTTKQTKKDPRPCRGLRR